MTLSSKTCTSASGVAIPALGLGTWAATVDDVDSCSRAVTTAITTGYTHIDTAALYESEDQVGKGIAKSGAQREDIFVCTKL
ncbi:NADP-dependent oxidoreductase domain-containing protein [Kockiozyma suomiensis]|uniref:NADP-dependent oxidoreductase domain-containing protein n=1 Tax=Kockiozyma suomiensis TaxID=1337062 RepID=UPI0033437DDB